MVKSSKSVKLALIGSALLLSSAGCGNDEEDDQNQADGGHRAGGPGVFIAPRVGGGHVGGGAAAGASARGGFGASGAAGVGS